VTNPGTSCGPPLLAAGVATAAFAETIDFDADPLGVLAAGWIAGVTGHRSHRWEVAADAGAASARNALRQSGRGDFPWRVKDGAAFANGYVEVKFKAVAGRQDQAGSVIWRWKGGDNYCVAPTNALDNNVALYCTQHGRRQTITDIDAAVAKHRWHVLRVEFVGTCIAVAFDGKRCIEREDTHIAGSGRVGVGTKADSVTVVDDFTDGWRPE
jgi:hypothetical protein